MLERSGLAPDDAAATADDVVGGGALPGALAWYRAARLRDLWAVGTVGVPTTYVWGTGDGALGGDAARRTGRWVLAPYRFVVLEGAGHWVHRDRPAAVADAIAARAAPYDGSTASRRGRSTA
jgi:pimeloyl-ACP methyl ester carboxylesterase